MSSIETKLIISQPLNSILIDYNAPYEIAVLVCGIWAILFDVHCKWYQSKFEIYDLFRLASCRVAHSGVCAFYHQHHIPIYIAFAAISVAWHLCCVVVVHLCIWIYYTLDYNSNLFSQHHCLSHHCHCLWYSRITFPELKCSGTFYARSEVFVEKCTCFACASLATPTKHFQLNSTKV